MADALGTPGPPGGPGVVSALDHRLDQAGMIATQGAGMAVRTGVMHGPGTTTLVTGTSATGTMTYAIAAHHWVSTRGTADGVYLGATEAAQTVSTGAAPGANSRIDVIWERQQDQYSTVTPDATSAPEWGVTQGTAAVSPVKPTIPVGALELATAVVAAGATSTNGAGVTITNTARQTAARGAPIPVRNQAERDALESVGYPGLTVRRLDLTGLPEETYSGTGTTWYRVGGDTGWLNCTLVSPWTGPCIARRVGSVVEVRADVSTTGASVPAGAFYTFGQLPAGIPAPSPVPVGTSGPSARGAGLSGGMSVPAYVLTTGALGFANSTGAARTAITVAVTYLAG